MKHEPQERKEASELQPQRALQQSCTEPPTVHHVRRQESIDFITNPNSIKHTPITFLTAKSLNLLHVIEKLNQEDLEAVNTMSEFVFTLNRCQIEKFGTVMEKLKSSFNRQLENHLRGNISHQYPIIFPASPSEIRSSFITGKSSLKENLPHPMIENTDDHSYCLPSDCISDFLCKDINYSKSKLLHEVE